VSKANPVIFVGVLVVAPAPSLFASLFFLLANADLAGGFACRRCCGMFSLLVL